MSNRCSHRTRANKVFAEFVNAGEGLLTKEILDEILRTYIVNIEVIQYFKNWKIWLWLTLHAYKLAPNYQYKKRIIDNYWETIIKARAITSNIEAQEATRALFVKSNFIAVGVLLEEISDRLIDLTS